MTCTPCHVHVLPGTLRRYRHGCPVCAAVLEEIADWPVPCTPTSRKRAKSRQGGQKASAQRQLERPGFSDAGRKAASK